MIYDSAYIDFEMLLRFIDEAEGPKRILTEPEILETLRVKSVKPRAFIPIELIEEVTHFNTQDDYKHITREQYLVYLKSLLGPKSNHPTDGFVEIELDTNNLHDLAESWNAYKWESITPFVYGSSYRDYQLGDILNLEKSVTLNLLPTNKSTNSFYDEGDRIILFTVYD